MDLATQGFKPGILIRQGRGHLPYFLHGSRVFPVGQEARPDAEYSVRLRNNTSGRVAVALAVDGLNSIDAKHTSASRAAKWILGPWETTLIAGWQTSSSKARRFFFTTSRLSFAETIQFAKQCLLGFFKILHRFFRRIPLF